MKYEYTWKYEHLCYMYFTLLSNRTAPINLIISMAVSYVFASGVHTYMSACLLFYGSIILYPAAACLGFLFTFGFKLLVYFT